MDGLIAKNEQKSSFFATAILISLVQQQRCPYLWELRHTSSSVDVRTYCYVQTYSSGFLQLGYYYHNHLFESCIDSNSPFYFSEYFLQQSVSRRARGVSVAGFCSAVIRSRAAAAAMSVVAAVGIRKSVGSQSTVSLFLVAIVLTIQHLKFL